MAHKHDLQRSTKRAEPSPSIGVTAFFLSFLFKKSFGGQVRNQDSVIRHIHMT